MESVKAMVETIKGAQTQVASSSKDEVRVMRAMLSDTSYEVDVYDKSGCCGHYNPAKDFQSMCASVIADVAKIPKAEASAMMEGYDVKIREATSMIGISKEFVNTYLQTGRKLPLGGREKSDISLSSKHVPESTRLFPQKVGVNEDGTGRYQKSPSVVYAHDSVRVHAPCPAWVKK